jgi:hypothetical protein
MSKWVNRYIRPFLRCPLLLQQRQLRAHSKTDALCQQQKSALDAEKSGSKSGAPQSTTRLSISRVGAILRLALVPRAAEERVQRRLTIILAGDPIASAFFSRSPRSSFTM